MHAQQPFDCMNYKIISPHDAGIAQAINENLEPQSWDTSIVDTSPFCEDLTDAMIKSYFAALETLGTSR